MSTLPRTEISHAPIRAILQWIRDRSRSDDLNDLQACGEKEVERMARDAGLSAGEFRALASLGPNAPDLLERRMTMLDLDLVEVSAFEPQTVQDLQRVCSFCESHRRCVCETLRAIPPIQHGRIIAQTP